MKQNRSLTPWPFHPARLFRKGTARSLFAAVVICAALPAAVTALVSYHSARRHLEADIPRFVQLVAELKRRELEDYFDSRRADVGRQGRTAAMTGFFKAMKRRWTAAQTPLRTFVGSPSWSTLAAAHAAGIQLHADLHGYSDVLMIDGDGNVLYSSARGPELAVNLEAPAVSHSGLSEAFRQGRRAGAPRFAGFLADAADGRGRTAVITAPIDDGGGPVGLLAVKLSIDAIERLLVVAPDLVDGARTYLLDRGLHLLAGNDGLPIARGRDAMVDTAIARRWLGDRADEPDAARLPAALAGRGADGSLVMGTHAAVLPGDGQALGLIVEVDRSGVARTVRRLRTTLLALALPTVAAAILLAAAFLRKIQAPFHTLNHQVRRLVRANPALDIGDAAAVDTGDLTADIARLSARFTGLKARLDDAEQLLSHLIDMHRRIGGEREIAVLAREILDFLADIFDLRRAELYVPREDDGFTCVGRFPRLHGPDIDGAVAPGEGRIGQAAVTQTIALYRTDPADAAAPPVPAIDRGDVMTVPMVVGPSVVGVLELVQTGVFSRAQQRAVGVMAGGLALAVERALIHREQAALRDRQGELACSLAARERDIQTSRRELDSQRRAFETAEASLQIKTLELEAANAQMKKNAADLEAHMVILEEQKQELQAKNAELERTHRELSQKARQLELSSRYKTEFMANMSHELRTPLNSILLLSRLLRENKEQTLTGRQSEFARTIQAAGEDLSTLINDILDLAKVESGKLEVTFRSVPLRAIADAMRVSFAALAEQSGIDFAVDVAPEAPAHIVTDRKRLEQIIKNFLSNAFKFTAAGSIRLEIAPDANAGREPTDTDGSDRRRLVFSVADTGVGIPEDKHAMVFDAFQQVDGSIRRTYGGTGLGLSISRELARRLGGEITLESRPGEGSRFSLHVPVAHRPPVDDEIIRCSPVERVHRGEGDSCRIASRPSAARRRSVLAIGAAGIMLDRIAVQAQRSGFALLRADRFPTGLHLADYHQPAAVFVNLPSEDGGAWWMIERIKADAATRHLPVFGIAPHGNALTAAANGAAGVLTPPLTEGDVEAAFARIADWHAADDRTLLAVTPDRDALQRIADAVGDRPFHLLSADGAAEAQTILETRPVHAVILNPRIDASDRYALLAALQHDPLPLILFGDAPLEPIHRATAAQFEGTLNLSIADTPDHLLQILSARLHLPPEALDAERRQRLTAADRRPAVLNGRRILLVDDDMRTVFAISSLLEDKGADVMTGKSGKESLDKLNGFPDIDLILMDVMIAGVDGYQAIREIRRRDRFKTLPIIALTAKAMHGDRTKCVAAGADDYLAKPVNLDKLTSMLNIWLDPRLTEANPTTT